MAWMLYRHWNGSVIRRQVRVPASKPNGIGAFGASTNPLTLRRGAVGTIVNVLAEGARCPDYVKFKGYTLDWNFAAEVVIEKSKNPVIVWKDLQTMGTVGKEIMVVIPRRVMDEMEIEH